jgi:trk system potassium uptake protein TrkA
MKKQAVVIGLGQFGSAVARALSLRGVEVLAIDVNEDRVRGIAPHVTEAACFDATDETALARTSPDRRDVCICAIGDEAREASIICTALLKQMGAKKLMARSGDHLHARILTLVGAHHVVNPEREFGRRFASQILHEEIRGQMDLGDGVLISEIAVSDAFAGQPLSELKLPGSYGITVVAIRRKNSQEIEMPAADTTFEVGDVAVVVAKEEAVTQLMERGAP